MIPEQLTQPPVHLWSPASPKNDFFYLATKDETESDIFHVVFDEEVRRNIWPKRITEINWFEVIRCVSQGPWERRERRVSINI